MSNSPRSKFVERTVALWQPRTPRVLADEDARAIAENVIGFFDLLIGWTGATEEENHSTAAARFATASPRARAASRRA